MTAPMDLTDDDLAAIEKAATVAKSIADFDHAALAAYVIAVNPTVLLGIVATVRESRQKLSDARAALRRARDLDVRHGYCAMDGDLACKACAILRAINDALAATPAPVAVPTFKEFTDNLGSPPVTVLATSDAGTLGVPVVVPKIVRNESTPELREFWAKTEERAAAFEKHEPYWKHAGITASQMREERSAPVAVPATERHCLACGGLIGERLPASDYNVDVCWECAAEYKKACGVPAPYPVQLAYAECARIARRREELAWQHDGLYGVACREIAAEIEAAALRAGVKP